MNGHRLRESDVQRATLAQLSALPGPLLVYRVNVVMARAGGRPIKSVYRANGKLFTGHSDLVCIAAGRYVAIEDKATDGVQSDAQREFQGLVESAGGIYLLNNNVADTVARVRELLR